MPIYADYRVPSEVTEAVAQPASPIDGSWMALVMNWRIVVADLRSHGIDLHAREVRDSSWLGVRAAIFSLIDSPSRLREALTRR